MSIDEPYNSDFLAWVLISFEVDASNVDQFKTSLSVCSYDFVVCGVRIHSSQLVLQRPTIFSDIVSL